MTGMTRILTTLLLVAGTTSCIVGPVGLESAEPERIQQRLEGDGAIDLSGHVVDDFSGTPVTAAALRLVSKHHQHQVVVAAATVAPDGRYRIDGIDSAAAYVLTVSAPGYTALSLPFVTSRKDLRVDLRLERSAAPGETPVSEEPDQASPPQDEPLQPFSFSTVVLNLHGEHVSSATATLYRDDNGALLPLTSASSGATGYVRFDNVMVSPSWQLRPAITKGGKVSVMSPFVPQDVDEISFQAIIENYPPVATCVAHDGIHPEQSGLIEVYEGTQLQFEVIATDADADELVFAWQAKGASSWLSPAEVQPAGGGEVYVAAVANPQPWSGGIPDDDVILEVRISDGVDQRKCTYALRVVQSVQ